MFLPPENYSQDMTRKAYKVSATSYLCDKAIVIVPLPGAKPPEADVGLTLLITLAFIQSRRPCKECVFD